MNSVGNNAAAAVPTHVESDVLVIGAGGAGMYAALEAARAGAAVVLADRSLIGRGGATVMAQMTVAAALGEQTPDHWEYHLSDTLEAGRGLCNKVLAALLCEDGPRRLREMDDWKVGWARDKLTAEVRTVAMPSDVQEAILKCNQAFGLSLTRCRPRREEINR